MTEDDGIQQDAAFDGQKLSSFVFIIISMAARAWAQRCAE